MDKSFKALVKGAISILPLQGREKAIAFLCDLFSWLNDKGEVNFESLFKESIKDAFDAEKDIYIEKIRRTAEFQNKELENLSIDADDFVRAIKRKNDWDAVFNSLDSESDIVKILSKHLLEFSGGLEAISSDSSSASVEQLSRNIIRRFRVALLDKISANSNLFNEYLRNNIIKFGTDINEIIKGITIILNEVNINNSILLNEIKNIQAELQSFQNRFEEIALESNKKLDEVINLHKPSFDSLLNDIFAEIKAKDWPCRFRDEVINNTKGLLEEYRNMGEENTINFIKAIKIPFLSGIEKYDIYKDQNDFKRITECIALIRILYPDLKLSSKTAHALVINNDKNICLLHDSENHKYGSTLVALWKYVKRERMDLSKIFIVVVGNMTCNSCNGMGADINEYINESCLIDFLKVKDVNGKQKFNDIESDFYKLKFHCQDCIGAYEGKEVYDADAYRKKLSCVFGEGE